MDHDRQLMLDFKSARAEILRRLADFDYANDDAVTPFAGLTCYRRIAPARPMACLYQPSIAVILQGRKHLMVGGRRYTYDSSHYLLSALEQPAVAHVIEATRQKPYFAINLLLDLDAVRASMGNVNEMALARSSSGHGIGTAQLGLPMLRILLRMLDLLQTPQHQSALLPLLKTELIYWILCGTQGSRLREIACSRSDKSGVFRAIAIIRRNFKQSHRSQELAASVRMGASTLHRQFRAVTGMSPLQYQKHLRLHEARRLMLEENLDAGTVALEVGYESKTQFSREYRRLFGSPPKKSIRTLQLHPPMPPTSPSEIQLAIDRSSSQDRL